MPASDTGDCGWWVWAYTASSAVASPARFLRKRAGPHRSSTRSGFLVRWYRSGSRRHHHPGWLPVPPSVPGTTVVTGRVGGCAALFPGNGAYGGMQSADIVGNLRVDQAWGGAQIMGAAHEVNANYYTAAVLRQAPARPSGRCVGLGRGRRLQVEYAVHRSRRLLPDAGQRHQRRAALSVQYSEH